MLRNLKVFATSELGKPSHETTQHQCTETNLGIDCFRSIVLMRLLLMIE